ncbi:glutamate synthase [Adlercreutzia sp. ZJ304]|uniref:GltB/FmdC/FwdC-like GXGXG domain-containing protein n=1 Tax=Adlercreutzia sp. ZJ304 TaxID=2709791 RepID=UPI0013ED950C|nr:glutamate synthase [Adlercreutzia sp. ZJ304]
MLENKKHFVCDNNKEELTLGTLHFQEANELIRQKLAKCSSLILRNVFAQRYIGCAMPMGKSIYVFGTPGNDMAAYMDGGSIEVFGNAQDQIGNTMNDGVVVIHGRCGDAAGYAMRGGTIFIRDDCGWRVGINMKQYQDKCPTIVIGGNAGNFLGEYMAGGIILLLGKAGSYLATGMHGGVIYLRKNIDLSGITDDLSICPLDDSDETKITGLLNSYSENFGDELDKFTLPDIEEFVKIIPKSARPYANMYAN